MKYIIKLCILPMLLLGMLTGCEVESVYVPNRKSTPIINEVTVNNGSQITLPDSLSISYDVVDEIAPLSTLQIDVFHKSVPYISEKIRTKGNHVQVNNYKINFPFMANVAEGTTAQVVFTLMNVDGNWVQEKQELTIVRPTLPEVLYLIVDETVYDMPLSVTTGKYVLPTADYASTMSGYIATAKTLEESDFIWGSSGKVNVAEVVDLSSAAPIAISYGNWMVTSYTFDPVTFEVGVEGIEVDATINGVQMTRTGECLYAKVEFTKDQVFDIFGMDASTMYNRDFMEYNAEDGSFTFLGDTGEWEVMFSLKHKYFWVYNFNDIAPKCYWLVGSNFCQSPTWIGGLDGWVFDDIIQMGYFRNLGNGSYQLSVYLDKSNLDAQVYSKLAWDNEFTYSSVDDLEAPTGLVIHSRLKDIVATDAFESGYYKMVFSPNSADKTMVITKTE